jgi:hypothetical protein
MPVTGWPALICAILAVLLPTTVRAGLSGVVTGCEFTPYLPFVLISAIVLRGWLASAVALTSAAIMGGVFGGFRTYELPCFASASAMFLAASAVMIAVAVLGRHVLFALLKPGRDAGGLVFSLERGEVWASWYGNDVPVRLGTQRKVAEMMEDFLAQGKAQSAEHE